MGWGSKYNWNLLSLSSHGGIMRHLNFMNMFISTNTEESGTMIGGQLLKEHLTTSPPDMSPFFLRQYVKGHAGDVFEPYPQLLTEMVLRLPYQVHKYAESTVVQPAFEQVIVN